MAGVYNDKPDYLRFAREGTAFTMAGSLTTSLAASTSMS